MIVDQTVELNQTFVNDTLYQLLSYEYPERTLMNSESESLLKYLIETGLHKSAYNLVSGENGQIWNDSWKKQEEEIVLKLKKSETDQRPWFEDQTK